MELDKKVVITQPSKEVSDAGIKEIHRYLNKELDIMCYFPCEWGWDWVNTKGMYRGKLPNRVAARIKSYYGLKLTSEQRSMLGNIARKHLCTKDHYTIDFTNEFDWRPGDFGDHGSCFWGDNYPARKVMEENDVLAIRFYNEDGKGFGRAWLYELSTDAWVLFNAYGPECPEAASVFAMQMERNTGDNWIYKELNSLVVCDHPRGLVYINGCPQIIYKDGYDPEDWIDLDWDVPYFPCEHCESWTHEDEVYYDDDCNGPLCEDCYETLLDEREQERLEELEKLLEQEMEEEFKVTAGRTEIAHVIAQEAIRNSVIAQLGAGQMVMPGIWSVYNTLL